MLETYTEYTCDGFDMFDCKMQGVTDVSNLTKGMVRNMLKADGWKYIDGMDFCPECAKLYRSKNKQQHVATKGKMKIVLRGGGEKIEIDI